MPVGALLERGLVFDRDFDGEPARLGLFDFGGLRSCATWLLCFKLYWSLVSFLLKRGGDRALRFGGLFRRVRVGSRCGLLLGDRRAGTSDFGEAVTAEAVLTSASTACPVGLPPACGPVSLGCVSCDDFCGTQRWVCLHTGICVSFRGGGIILSFGGRRVRYVASQW